jgi:peptidoglycan/xylan/chitin deacetylase (PgdA/CDA1 family)
MGRWNHFRDDDINCYTDVGLLREVHELIVSHGKVHTVAVEVENIWRSKSVWFFLMTARNLDVVLHGWDHSDYSKLDRLTIYEHLEKSLRYWNEHSAAYDHPHPLKVWCPPWNLVSHEMKDVSIELGLTIDSRWKGETEVYGFHYWEMRCPLRLNKLKSALS